jgi:uracil-DNA glycosylase family 4
MKNINETIKNCVLCGNLPKLIDNSIQYGKTNFIIIGESPAKDGWIESKRAFYNTAGKLQGSGRILEKLLNNIGLSISDIYFTECCKCIIEDRKNLEKCSANCMPILIEQLNNLPCDVIVTMGLHPTQAILQTKIKKFADYVGKKFEVDLGNKKYALIPIYHPSPLNPKGYKDNVPIFESLKESLIIN